VLGVFGLSQRTTEDQLRDVFGAFGPLDKVFLITDHLTRQTKGYGFVYYKYREDESRAGPPDEKAAEAAASQAGGEALPAEASEQPLPTLEGAMANAARAKDATNGMAIDGRVIRVDFSKTRSGHEKTPGRYMGPRSERRPAPSYSPAYRRREDEDERHVRGYSRSERYDDRDRASRYDRYDERRDGRRYDRYDDDRYDDRRYEERRYSQRDARVSEKRVRSDSHGRAYEARPDKYSRTDRYDGGAAASRTDRRYEDREPVREAERERYSSRRILEPEDTLGEAAAAASYYSGAARDHGRDARRQRPWSPSPHNG
jgi:RNA recognition motif-containing protein